MAMTTNEAVAEALGFIEQAEAFLTQAKGRLREITGEEAEGPRMDAKTAARVERLGPVAHRHLAVIEANGSMTLGESLQIRRELYGEDVQATANLFGKKGSGALFWRDRVFKTPRHDNDPIRMTDEGERIARLWRATHQH